MSKKGNRWLKATFIVALLAVAAGCARSQDNATASNGSAKTTDAALPSAPAVSFENLQGQTVHLSQYRGKVVLVNFWATWCGPCRSEIPELIQFQNEYGNKGFTVLGVAMDQEGKKVVAPFVAKPQFQVGGHKVAMNYPIVLGNDKIATRFGGIIGLPTSFVISKDGKIVKKTIGVIDDKGMNQLIQKLL